MFVDFFKAYTEERWSKYFLAYCLPKKTVTAIMMLYKNIKAMVHSTDDDIDFLNIVAVVLQRYINVIFVYNPLRLHTLKLNRSNRRKCFYTKNGKKQMTSSRNYDRGRLHR